MITGTVTNTERRVAIQQAHDLEKLEKRAAKAVARMVNKLRPSIKRAIRSGVFVSGMFEYLYEEAAQELADLMTVAHLRGIARAWTNIDLRLSASKRAMEHLQNIFRLSDSQLMDLQRQYQGKSSHVLKQLMNSGDLKVQEAMLESITSQEHIRDATKRLNKAFNASGMTPQNSYQLENIFRTETQLAYSGAKWRADHQGIIGEMLWGYKYLTVGDDRVRPSHEAMDGTTLPENDRFWQENFPPNGWSCRCQAIELFEEREEVRPPALGQDEMGNVFEIKADPGFEFNPGLDAPASVAEETVVSERNRPKQVDKPKPVDNVSKKTWQEAEEDFEEYRSLDPESRDEYTAKQIDYDRNEAKEYREWKNKNYPDIEERIQFDEALGDYASDMYEDINGHLALSEEGRQQFARDFPDEAEHIERDIAILDEAFEKTIPLKSDKILHRGMEDMVDVTDLDIGGYVEISRGYVSTSTTRRTALDFGNRTNIQVICPKGSKGVLRGFNAGEQEYLFKRGTRFRIVNIMRDEYGVNLQVVYEDV